MYLASKQLIWPDIHLFLLPEYNIKGKEEKRADDLA